MQTEFTAIVDREYGAAEDVLRLAERQFECEELGPDDVLVHVAARPVHPCDIQILSALPQGGPVVPIPEGTLRAGGRSFRWKKFCLRKENVINESHPSHRLWQPGSEPEDGRNPRTRRALYRRSTCAHGVCAC